MERDNYEYRFDWSMNSFFSTIEKKQKPTDHLEYSHENVYLFEYHTNFDQN